ncbi:hypothetical protein BC941DRAFT_439677 [Chlamydoabsidia padenii]|nr:hypothetical protein BC941DRAFT_439677 [Chlamydoabsidia padenii]
MFTRRFFTRLSLNQPHKRRLLLRCLLYSLLVATIIGYSIYTIDWNFHISIKSWLIRGSDTITPNSLSLSTSSCFQAPYTTQLKHSPPLTPGIPLIRLDQCLGFANTITDDSQQQDVWFHTYWIPSSGTGMGDDNDAQLLSMLRSFSATQSDHSKMTIWVQDPHQETLLTTSSAWHFAKEHMEQQKKQQVTTRIWTSVMMGNKVQHNMDYIGMLILQQYGGVWFHPSILFMRNWSSLLGKREWMTQHDCQATHTGSNSLLNPDGQLMHFFANSSLLCHLIDTATTSRIDLGRVYRNVYRDLMKHGIRPWSILPWCLMNSVDGCSTNDGLQLFKKPKGRMVDKVLQDHGAGIFALQYDVDQWITDSENLMGKLIQSHQTITGW